MLHKKGYDYPFEPTKTIIQTADVTMANLKAPLTLRANQWQKYKSGLILYSLGNHDQFGGLAGLTLTVKGVEDLSLTLLDVNNFRRDFKPIPLEGEALAKAFL